MPFIFQNGVAGTADKMQTKKQLSCNEDKIKRKINLLIIP